MNDSFHEVVNTVGDLPPMPLVAVKVLELLQEKEISAALLARTISHDPAVAAKVLRIANSSLYSLSTPAKTLERAITVLGEKTLKSLVLAASLVGINNSYGLIEKLLWEDSIGCAIAARSIAKQRRTVDPEEAFLGGLFRHIGKLVLNNYAPDKFAKLIQGVYNNEGTSNSLELEYFPFSHAVVGAAVLKKWKMSDSLIRVVLNHENRSIGLETDPVQRELIAIINLANSFCRLLGIGRQRPDVSLVLAETTGARILQLDATVLDVMKNNFLQVFEADKELFLH